MDLSFLYNSLSYIKPEIAIVITLLLIVFFDLIFQKNKSIIPIIATVGILVAAILSIGEASVSASAFKGSNGSFGLFALDPIGTFFKLLVLGTSLFIVYFSYSSTEIRKIADRLGEYYALIFGMIVGMMFLISATDLVLIYLSLELLSLSSYVLAGFTKLQSRNSEASIKYVIYGAISSGLMLFGISIVYGLTGTTNLYAINSLLQGADINILTTTFAGLLIFAGIGYKISSVPFHFWTPDVYEGSPITITAYLAVASKAAGFMMLIRVVRTAFVTYVGTNGHWNMSHAFDWASFLILISILTMTFGNLVAIWQDNLKRMLAYSSIAHAGYLLLGLVALSNQGVLAIMIYFLVYAITNLGAFYTVMLVANKIDSEDIHDYNGLGFTSPLIGVSFVIILVSLTGLPPTAGFIGKLYIFGALVDSHQVVVAVIAIINSVISLYYYMRVVKHMYLKKATESTPAIPTSFSEKSILVLLAGAVLIFGIYQQPIIDFAQSGLKFLGF